MNPVMCHLQNPPFWFGVYPHPAFIGANTAHAALGLGLSMGVAAPPSPSVRIPALPCGASSVVLVAPLGC